MKGTKGFYFGAYNAFLAQSLLSTNVAVAVTGAKGPYYLYREEGYEELTKSV